MAKQITNTLSGFKQVLKSALTNGIYIKSTLFDYNENPCAERSFAPVGRAQSNAFTIFREGKEFWCEFGKAENWTFDLPNGKATKLYNGKKTIQFTIDTPAFFGF